MLVVGTKAPEFTLQNQVGKEISLSDFRGRKVILYFYPKDNTPACTAQACGYRDLHPAFSEKGATVIGISKDTVTSHRKFADNFEITFPILADTELKVIQAYDVWKEKSMYGKKFMGVVRSAYLINEEGIIIKAFEKVKAANNASDMLINI
ncbi:MAG: bcp [Herbinix sp.]|jgi:peroxiredoxin Q/BCP|nr:bcp [Herbinix sp.]